MDFGTQYNTLNNNDDEFTSLTAGWDAQREAARKRFDEFRKQAEQRRRQMFDSSWPHDMAFGQSPLSAAMVSVEWSNNELVHRQAREMSNCGHVACSRPPHLDIASLCEPFSCNQAAPCA